MKNKSKLSPVFSVSIIVAVSVMIFSGCGIITKDALPEPALVVTSTETLAEPATMVLPTETVEEPKDALPLYPMDIEALRAREYPASDLIIEETLAPGANYQRFIASYVSDGNRIYGLLTIPNTQKPEGGYPTILFLHGFIPPDTYVTTADYVASQDGLASSGFVTYKPDLRGHGRSEGVAVGAHFSEAYVVDTLNALSALEADEAVDPGRIGVWGHSNGGLLGLRAIVITDRIKASVFWAGVVGSYTDLLETYFSRIDFLQRLAPVVIKEFGIPSENPDYWMRIDPYTYLDAITGPVQLHHGTADSSVPVELSVSLNDALLEKGKDVELYQYPGADHNLYSTDFTEAMSRTVEFFRTHLE